MRVLGDVITSLYNFRHIGKTLSKRPVGMVAGSFTILVVIYVLVFGLWYSSMFGKFIGIMFDKAKPMMPTFSIVGGRLQMHSSEPYIITHVEFVQLVHESILEMSKQTSDVKLAGDITEGLTEQKIRQQMRPDQTFCFVMDTTGQWKDRVNLDHYTQYAVITKDTMERVDRVKSMPGNIKPISETIKQDIKFIPDLVDRLKLPLNRISTIAWV